MIRYVKRQDLEVDKYNYCIENAIEPRIYAFSWYLDIVADHWDVLVSNDYEAVMPIPWKRKFFIKYVTQPLWLLELGIFSLTEEVDCSSFFTLLFSEFNFVDLRLNTANKFNDSDTFLLEKQMQILRLGNTYKTVVENYRKDRKKDLRKATEYKLIEKWNDISDTLITLFKNNVGKRTSNITDENYKKLKNLIDVCIQKNVGEILSVYDEKKKLVASGFFLKHKGTVTILVSSTDFKNRKNGANTFLIDRAIFKYEKNNQIFNFGGSSRKTIAKYFLSFGAKTETYYQIKQNNLPLLVKLFKN